MANFKAPIRLLSRSTAMLTSFLPAPVNTAAKAALQ